MLKRFSPFWKITARSSPENEALLSLSTVLLSAFSLQAAISKRNKSPLRSKRAWVFFLLKTTLRLFKLCSSASLTTCGFVPVKPMLNNGSVVFLSGFQLKYTLLLLKLQATLLGATPIHCGLRIIFSTLKGAKFCANSFAEAKNKRVIPSLFIKF